MVSGLLLALCTFTAGVGSDAASSQRALEGGGDPLALLAMRSPGGRGAGALLQTKPGRVGPLAAGGPEERVLSAERDRPPFIPSPDTDAFAGDMVEAPTLFPAVSDAIERVPAAETGGPGNTGPSSFIPDTSGLGGFGAPGSDFIPASGTGTSTGTGTGTGTSTGTDTGGGTGETPVPPPTPPGGSPGGGDTPPTQVVTIPPGQPGGTPPFVTPPPPVAGAIPEPSAWMTMIVGFTAIGAALRRRAYFGKPRRRGFDV